ncbi:MAG: thermonuclease family protein [Spirochaeta sp.]|nr:thermonuclease family protein [Spirochaeta sp.]
MTHRVLVFFSALLLCTLAPTYLEAQIVFESEVQRVVDGDTVVLQVGDVRYRGRLHGIDAPESNQPWGGEATALLRDLLSSGLVTVEVPDIDRYGRLIVRLYRDELFINEELVARGAAWRYPEFDVDNEFGRAELLARAEGRGLWGASAGSSGEEPVAPWEWRRR